MLRAVALSVVIVFSVTVLGACAHRLPPVEEPVRGSSNPDPPDKFEIQGSAEAMIGDLLILRPIGIAVTALGAAVFIVSLPFSVLGGNTKDAFHELVVDPARFTFNRPLGVLKGAEREFTNPKPSK